MSIHRYRRLTGLLFGAGLGLAFGLTSQLTNRLLLPGVPLYQPPLGPLVNMLLSLITGALLGVISAWPESSIQGTFVASAVSALVIVAGNFALARPSGNTLVAILLTGIFLVLPFWAMLVPLIAALRWGVNKLVDAHDEHLPIRSRIAVPILLILAVGVVGYLFHYRTDARLLLTQTHALLQESQAAVNADALPASLRDLEDGPFLEKGRDAYELSWERQRIERFRIPRPGKNFDYHSVVVARFKSGWNLVCLYVASGHRAPVQRFRGVTAMTEQRYRRAAGAILGLMFGFAYAVVSQLANRLALPGIPLYQPPLGSFGNILLGLLAGAALGLLCAWPVSPAKGIFLGGAAAAVAIFVITLLRMGTGAAPTLIGLIFSVPMAWVSVLGMAVVRWLVDRQVEARRESAPLLRRLRLPLILTCVMGLLALFALHSADARLELRRMNDMVQAGLRATGAASLPVPLRAPSVVGFPAGTRSVYSLEWTNVDLDRFIALRPAANYDRQAAVIARFRNGPLLACIYTAPKAEPNCGTY